MTPNPKARSLRRGWLLVAVLSALTSVVAIAHGETGIAVMSGLLVVLSVVNAALVGSLGGRR